MSNDLTLQKIESILFVTQKPLGLKKISTLVSAAPKETESFLVRLMDEYNGKDRGIILVRTQDNEYYFTTNPLCSTLIQDYLKEDVLGELTRPALETLAVIAYRGPVSKIDIEQIRGVNCSLALRNLLIRGLVEVVEDKKAMSKIYTLSVECMNHFGIQSVTALQDYEKLHAHELMNQLLSQNQKNPE